MVWRRSGVGIEVLMGMRGAGHRFMPRRLVFPGGAVDPGDETAPVASEPRADVLALLCRAASPALARALAYAAARELVEETALSLGDPPALDGLEYLCRAVTPSAQPIRFNARFLAVPEGRVRGSLAGSGELEGLRFYGLAEALGHDLVHAQRVTLETLRDLLARPEAAWRQPRPVPVFSELALGLE